MTRPMEILMETKCMFDHKCLRSFAQFAHPRPREVLCVDQTYTTGPNNELRKGSYLG